MKNWKRVSKKPQEQGYALVLTLTLITVTALSLAAYSILTADNANASRNSGNSSAGFYAAEAALNSRAERVRQKFKGFQVPAGTSPADSSTQKPCLSGNNGTDDFICETATLNNRQAISYVVKGKTEDITIPQGDTFENLSAQETTFTVKGRSYGPNNTPEAIAELTFRSRLVPLFQFAVFFDKDLEFDRTAPMTLSGPVHTNGWLFLDSGSPLNLQGQVTSAERIYRGLKQTANCNPGRVFVNSSATTPTELTCPNSSRFQVTGSALNPYNGRLKDNLGRVEVPTIQDLQPVRGGMYWENADVRIVLKRVGSSLNTWNTLFVKSDGTQINTTGIGCNLALNTSGNLRNNREAQYWDVTDNTKSNLRVLNIDVRQLLTCMQNSKVSLGINGLDENSGGGLVIYATVDDFQSSTVSNGLLRSSIGTSNGNFSQTNPPVANNYAVRLYNGELLRSLDPTHPAPKGITFVTDQAAFIEGNFNAPATRADGWIPAAVMSDSINILSSNWRTPQNCTRVDSGTSYTNVNNGNTPLWVGTQAWYRTNTPFGITTAALTTNPDLKSTGPLACRNAGTTTIRTAILAGSATTGTSERTIYTGETTTSGGVHNMTRFHENWNYGGINFTYRGSLVSLNRPLHAVGAFQLDRDLFYTPPQRLWSFEEAFRNAADLPPLTPRFVYIKQDNFVRNFEQ